MATSHKDPTLYIYLRNARTGEDMGKIPVPADILPKLIQDFDIEPDGLWSSKKYPGLKISLFMEHTHHGY